jgi:hypothetical protein
MPTVITNCPYISPLIFISSHYVLHSKYVVLRLTVQRWVSIGKVRKTSSRMHFIDPWLGDKVNSGTGLSYRPANHVAWRAGTKTLRRSWLCPPSQGSMNSATGYRLSSLKEIEENQSIGRLCAAHLKESLWISWISSFRTDRVQCHTYRRKCANI